LRNISATKVLLRFTCSRGLTPLYHSANAIAAAAVRTGWPTMIQVCL